MKTTELGETEVCTAASSLNLVLYYRHCHFGVLPFGGSIFCNDDCTRETYFCSWFFHGSIFRLIVASPQNKIHYAPPTARTSHHHA